MKANPGGEIAPEDVVGRNRFIERLWEVLESQSVVLMSERRMGKSSVIKKMRLEAPAGRLVFYADVEGLDTPIDFAERVHRDTFQHLSTLQQTKSKARALLKELSGLEVPKVGKLPAVVAPRWRHLLEAAIDDLMRHHDCPAIFFWDELPLMLQRVKGNSGEKEAMSVLDVLRALRQTYTRLRMVYTGSIGLHHVLSDLRKAGHTNAPTNDMRPVELLPLEEPDARFLANALLQGEDLKCPDPDAVAATLAGKTDGIPYYIHHVVAAMRDRGRSASENLVASVIQESLTAPHDPWNFRHYRNRLDSYYGKDRVSVVLCLLDELAASESALSFDTLYGRLATHLDRETGEAARQILDGDREQLRRLLELLQEDHYIARRSEDGAYLFRFPLIKRWWRMHRNLSC